MNYRYEIFKYQEIQSTENKMDIGNYGLFSNPFYGGHFLFYRLMDIGMVNL